MAAVVSSSFTPAPYRPQVSSPLASAAMARAQPRSGLSGHSKHISLNENTAAPPTHMFPTSRPLRPFPSIANSVARPSSPGRPAASGGRKAQKIIEPPKNVQTAFVLNLTQAELSRQDDD